MEKKRNLFRNSKEFADYLLEYCIPSYIANLGVIPKPFVLGITGLSSAVGKTTISEEISKNHNAVSIDLDNWIVIPRKEREHLKISGINPAAWDIEDLHKSLSLYLYSGKIIRMPIYDHQQGSQGTSYKEIEQANIVCIAGAACLWESIRLFVNLMVCIQPDNEATAKKLAIERNINERNYTLNEANNGFIISQNAYNQFVLPYKKYSDIIVEVNENYQYRIF